MTNNFFIEVNRQKLKGFQSVQVTKTLENFVDTFSIELSTQEKIINKLRVPQNLIKAGDEIRIFIDENLIFTGFSDKVSIAYNIDNHQTNIGGRSRTGDLVDSSMIRKSYSQKDFKRLVENVLTDNGYTDISVLSNTTVDQIENSTLFKKQTNTKTSTQTIFEFLDSYAQKVQVLLRTNEEGNIVLTREENGNTIGNLINTKNNPNNNIKSATIIVDNINRFRFNQVQGQGDNSSYFTSTVNQSGESEDTLIRSPRRKISSAKSASVSDELGDLAKWETNLRRAKSLNYSCVVQGYYNDKKSTSLWQPNTLVKVLDDKCLLDGQFLIKGVIYNKAINGGSTTTLNIVNRGAFNLDPDIIVAQLDSNDFASQLSNNQT